MRRERVLEAIRAHAGELEVLGVSALYLFGSVARDEADASSDIDLLVELSRPMGLAFFDIQFALERWLGRPVDLVTPDALHHRLRERILAEAVRAA